MYNIVCFELEKLDKTLSKNKIFDSLQIHPKNVFYSKKPQGFSTDMHIKFGTLSLKYNLNDELYLINHGDMDTMNIVSSFFFQDAHRALERFFFNNLNLVFLDSLERNVFYNALEEDFKCALI